MNRRDFLKASTASVLIATALSKVGLGPSPATVEIGRWEGVTFIQSSHLPAEVCEPCPEGLQFYELEQIPYLGDFT